MSTELTVATERGMSMAELMGVTSSGGAPKTSKMIDRITQVHSPIMGEVEFNGKKIKTEVVPVGAFKVQNGEDVIYSTSATIRIFMMRQQWQRWNGETGEMEKSVMSQNLQGDLQDSIGGFNLGRPSGYIEDFNALPEATKQLMRTVKRVKVYMGELTMDNPTNALGEPANVGSNFTKIPFVMDVKNRDSIKSLDDAVGAITRNNQLPIMAEIKIRGVEDSIPTGAKFGKIEAMKGDTVQNPDNEGDNEKLNMFLDSIEAANGRILDLYHERSDRSISPEDAKVVNSIIDSNDFVEVDE